MTWVLGCELMNVLRIDSSIFGNLLGIVGVKKCKTRNLGYTYGAFLMADNSFNWFKTLIVCKRIWDGFNRPRNLSTIFINFC